STELHAILSPTSDVLPELPSTAHVHALTDRVFPGKPVDFLVRPLQGDASDRRYYRLNFASAVDGITSLVLMRLAQPYIAGELPFVNMQRYLSLNRVAVPDMLWDAYG